MSLFLSVLKLHCSNLISKSSFNGRGGLVGGVCSRTVADSLCVVTFLFKKIGSRCMQKSLERIYNRFYNAHYDELVVASTAADSVDTSEVRLGVGQEMVILAATGLSSVDEILGSAVVIKRIRRGALIQVNNLLYYANKYGVLICYVPSRICIGSFTRRWGPAIPHSIHRCLLDSLNVKVECPSAGGDRLFDYSSCIEMPVNW